MGQKVSPIWQRLGINKVTDSRWIAGKKDYAKLLAEDHQIRNFIEKKLKKAGLAKIVIERLAKKVVVTVHTSRPGMIIGKNGAMLKKIGTYARQDLEKMLDTKVNLKVWVKVKEDWQNNDSLVKKFKLQ